jgi:hypothetical protein
VVNVRNDGNVSNLCTHALFSKNGFSKMV